MSPSTQTAATRRPRIIRTASQKKRSAVKAAETRARNKAAKAAQGGQGATRATAAQPDEPSTVDPPAPRTPQTQPGTFSENTGQDSAPTTQQPVPPPPRSIGQDTLRPAPRVRSPTPSPQEQLPGPSFNPEPETNQGSGSVPALSGSSSSAVESSAVESSAGPSTNSSAPSRRVREKKPILYRSYDPKEAIGLAGQEHKERWLRLRETVRSLLKAQRFQEAQSWTRHTLTQRAVVVTETHKELTKRATTDPEWVRVVRQPLFQQVIEDIAKDCCNNVNSYKSQKQKKFGTG